MKCPHCKKDLDTNPQSPTSLLLHLNVILKRHKDSLSSWDCIHGVRYIGREKILCHIERWQAWVDWVEEKIKGESDG